MFKKVLNIFFERKVFASLITLTVIFQSILGITVPYLNGSFIDMLISSFDTNSIINFAIILGAMNILLISITYISSKAFAKNNLKLEYRILSAASTHIEHTEFFSISQFNPVYLSQRVKSDINQIVNFVMTNYISIFFQSITIITSLSILFNINYKIFIICITFIPIYISVYIRMRENLQTTAYNAKEVQNIFDDSFNNTIERNYDTKLASLYDQSKSLLSQKFNDMYEVQCKYINSTIKFSSLDSLISSFFQASILVIGGYEVIKRKLTIGEFSIINIYFSLLINSIKYYMNLFKTLQSINASYRRISEIFELKQEEIGEAKVTGMVNNISINNLSFGYSPEQIIVKDFSYNFILGKMYAIVGDNGVGKTTLFNLFSSILKDQSNSIFINDIPYNQYDVISLRKNNFTFVPKDITWPNEFTVLEYALYYLGIDNLTYKNLLETDEIKELPIFYDYKTLENKKISDLSDGQRKTIQLFISILRNTEVLVLDEPTNFLDKQKIVEIIEILKKLKPKRLIILISHDKRIIDICDETIHIK